MSQLAQPTPSTNLRSLVLPARSEADLEDRLPVDWTLSLIPRRMTGFSAIAVAHRTNHKRSLGKRTIGF
jgi:hypothetical protein